MSRQGVAPFPIEHELAGWELFWVLLEMEEGTEGDERLAALLRETSELARASLEGIDLASHATVAAMRKLFRAAGTDPTRYRPASEALLRRVLKGEDLPAIHPLVDINNCLSVELAVPCCVAAEGTFTPPLVLRAGRPGESYESLRGSVQPGRKAPARRRRGAARHADHRRRAGEGAPRDPPGLAGGLSAGGGGDARAVRRGAGGAGGEGAGGEGRHPLTRARKSSIKLRAMLAWTAAGAGRPG